jgi:septal ring factor EnvC (AmiA/AmiB activator)
MIPFAAVSQTDTVCIPRVDAIRKLIQIERLKQDSVELQAKKQDMIELAGIANSQETTISNLRMQITTYDLKEQNYKNQIGILNKQVKKLQRKNKWTAFGGLALTAIVGGLFLFK